MRGQLFIITILIILVILMSGSVIGTTDKLNIDKVLVEMDGDQIFSGSGTSGYMDAKPDTEIEFEVTVENMWDRDNDDSMRINDIEVDAVLYDIDDGDDLTYSSSRFDLRAEGYKTISWDWDIPNDVESDQNYELEIRVRGYDENGDVHEDKIVIDVEIERSSHELVFEELRVYDPVPCGDMAKIRIEIENNGEHDEEVTLRVESDSKGLLLEKEFDIEAFDEDDNTYDLTKTFDVSGLPDGRYTLDVTLEYDDKKLTDTVELRVPICDEIRNDRDRDDCYSGVSKQSRSYDVEPSWDGEAEVYFDQQRSRNADFFKTVDAPTKVTVKYDPSGYIPSASMFEDGLPKKKSSDVGFYGLIVANLVLLIVIIVALVLIGINVFEL